jgi:hypothetical protein
MRDWKAAYGAPPPRFEEAVERALREKEEKKMIHGRKNWTILLIAALITALLAGMAYAAVESGLLDSLRDYGIEPAEGAEETIQKDLGSSTIGHTTMTITEAAYAGKTLDMVIAYTRDDGNSPSRSDVEVTAEEMELDNIATGMWTEGDVEMEWVTIMFDEETPDRLTLTVTASMGAEVSFVIDRTEAVMEQPISEKTVSDDGTFTVYSFEIYRSLLSQVVYVNFDYDLPAPRMGYWVEFLDADGNVLDYGMGGGIGRAFLEDGSEVFREDTILALDAEVAALRIIKTATDETFGTIPVPQN